MSVDQHAARYRSFLVAAITLGLITWRVAFNLGAYNTVFYEDVYAVVVASTIAFGASFLAPHEAPRRVRIPAVSGRILLAAPAIWTVLALSVTGSLTAAESSPILMALGVIIGATSVPCVLLLLARVVVPSLETLRGRPLAVLIVMTALVAAAGWLTGRHNDRFMTCNDFKVAGQDQPRNCTP
ncbi:hypothetical protein [Frankia sp. Cas4]|uniref:hypothetical protein n=1 Tax=Frankia sp. Cas4 TaxID=3073927 RepID=UPI002AD2B4C3|nr:hypothetical protein [Frankia sp. Cas4]